MHGHLSSSCGTVLVALLVAMTTTDAKLAPRRAGTMKTRHGGARQATREEASGVMPRAAGQEHVFISTKGKWHDIPDDYEKFTVPHPSGVQHSCYLPPPWKHGEEARFPVARAEVIEEIISRHAGDCVTFSGAYWTWRVCHMQSVEQYHVRNGHMIRNRALVGNFVPSAGSRSKNTTRVFAQISSGGRLAGKHTYFSHAYSNGSECTVGKQEPRRATVLYKCGRVGSPTLVESLEKPPCNHTLVIEMAELCTHAAFREEVDRNASFTGVLDPKRPPRVKEVAVLLETSLKSRCFYAEGEGWYAYEFCFGRHVRKFRDFPGEHKLPLPEQGGRVMAWIISGVMWLHSLLQRHGYMDRVYLSTTRTRAPAATRQDPHVEQCRAIFNNTSCPEGWTMRIREDEIGCNKPVSPQLNTVANPAACGDFSHHGDMSMQQKLKWEHDCHARWVDPAAARCPWGWTLSDHDGGSCSRPHDYSGDCDVLVNVDSMNTGTKIHWAGRCRVVWLCDSKALPLIYQPDTTAKPPPSPAVEKVPSESPTKVLPRVPTPLIRKELGEGSLIISEYVEGSGYTKAIELFNPTCMPIDLRDYALLLLVNGGAWQDATAISLASGQKARMMAPGSTFVICHSGVNQNLMAAANGAHRRRIQLAQARPASAAGTKEPSACASIDPSASDEWCSSNCHPSMESEICAANCDCTNSVEARPSKEEMEASENLPLGGDASASVCNLMTSELNFNGDDAVGLAFTHSSSADLRPAQGTAQPGVSDTESRKAMRASRWVVDAVGWEGDDPGRGWDVAGHNLGTADKTLVRKKNVLVGTRDWDIARGRTSGDSEWIVQRNRDWLFGLASHKAAACEAHARHLVEARARADERAVQDTLAQQQRDQEAVADVDEEASAPPERPSDTAAADGDTHIPAAGDRWETYLGYRDPSRLELHKKLEDPAFDPQHGDPQTLTHVTETYTHGEECVADASEGAVLRQTTVHYRCAKHGGEDQIARVTETSPCKHEVIFDTKDVCEHHTFRDHRERTRFIYCEVPEPGHAPFSFPGD